MKYLKTYKQLNEGLRDKMVAVSDEKIEKSLKGLSDIDVLINIINYNLDHKYLPRDEDGYFRYQGDIEDILFVDDDEIQDIKLPDNMIISGDLDCSYLNLNELPKGLDVYGLTCSYNNLKELPDDLITHEFLDCSFNKIKKIPDNFKVYGNLAAESNHIKEFPKKLEVMGDIDFTDNYIKELPNNLTISNSLWLSNNYLKKLPFGLSVSKYLDISGNGITELPDDLIVGEILYVDKDYDFIPKGVSKIQKGGK